MQNVIHWIRRVFPPSRSAVIWGILIWTLLAAYVLWYSSAGRFPDFPENTNAYIDLGESFLHGQVALLEEPDPQFIALENPYDPTQRTVPYRWDASYYDGKYYLYWGPVPALIFAAIEGLTHVRPPGSLVIVFFYISLPLLFFAILFQLWRRFFPSAPGASIGLFILIGFVNLPFLFLLGRVEVYETSIIAGQFFLWLGLLGWIMYSIGTAQVGWLVVAGLSWGLAIGSRYNLLISVIIYLAFMLVYFARDDKIQQNLKKIALVVIPLAVCLAGLGAYNFVRFGNPFETGMSYQLTIPDARSDYYSLSYFPSNLFIYLLFPMETMAAFPFVVSTLPLQFRADEIVAGLVPSVPSIWILALLGPYILLIRKRISPHADIPVPASLRSLTSMIAIAGLAQFLFLMVFFFGAMRYMADFYLSLVFLIAVFIWRMDELVKPEPLGRTVFWLVIIGFMIWTTGIGFFGAFDIPPRIFHDANPALYSRLETYWNHLYGEFLPLLQVVGIPGTH